MVSARTIRVAGSPSINGSSRASLSPLDRGTINSANDFVQRTAENVSNRLSKPISDVAEGLERSAFRVAEISR